MSTTYALVLRPPRKDGLCPVHLRLTSGRTACYRAVPGMALSAALWNPAASLEKPRWVRTGHPQAKDWNSRLHELLLRAGTLTGDDSNLSANDLRAALFADEVAGGAAGPDLLAYMRADVARRARLGHPRTAEKFESIHNKLQSFVLGIPHPQGRYALAREPAELRERRAAARLPFADLKPRLARDYEDYLSALGNRRTTIQKEFSFLNTVALRAVEEELLPAGSNPFGKRAAGVKAKARPKARLSEEEVGRLEALTVAALTAPRPGAPAAKRVRGRLWAREAWLLQYYLLGSRVGDALTLRWGDVEQELISFTEHKTGKRKVAPRHAALDAVLARLAQEWALSRAAEGPPPAAAFVLPYLDERRWYADLPAGTEWVDLARSVAHRPHWLALLKKVESATANVNKNLKRVALLAGIDKALTSHTARHSFADRGRRLKVATADMRDMLNHHSIAQTEAYYGELEESEVSAAALSIYTTTPGGRAAS